RRSGVAGVAAAAFSAGAFSAGALSAGAVVAAAPHGAIGGLAAGSRVETADAGPRAATPHTHALAGVTAVAAPAGAHAHAARAASAAVAAHARTRRGATGFLTDQLAVLDLVRVRAHAEDANLSFDVAVAVDRLVALIAAVQI